MSPAETLKIAQFRQLLKRTPAPEERLEIEGFIEEESGNPKRARASQGSPMPPTFWFRLNRTALRLRSPCSRWASAGWGWMKTDFAPQGLRRAEDRQSATGERQRDQALLSTLSAGDRTECEGLVEIFVQAELDVITPEGLRSAADKYEEAGRDQPSGDGVTGLLFAAILRERAATLTM